MPNFYERFLESVRRWPDGLAVEVQHQNPDQPRDRYTFSELRQMSDSVARWLSENQPRGTHCALLAGNGPGWIATFLGALAAANVVVPLDTSLNHEQIRKLLKASDAALLFIDAKHRPIAERATEGLPVKIIDIETLAPQGTQRTQGFTAIDVEPQQTAAILYSSGTTGDPKGVMLTHDNFYAETGSICEVIALGPSDSILGILPLFHALALVVNLLLPMAAGARVVFLESLNTADLLKALPTVNIFVCVPQFFYLIHERIWKEVTARGRLAEKALRAMLGLSHAGRKFGLNLGKVLFRKIHHLIGPNMRYLATGGSRFAPEIGREFEALGFTMLQGYGLTETSGAATYTPPKRVNIASVGGPLPGVEVKIVNAQVREDDPSGPPAGEIAIRGRIVMKGYYNRPDATEAVLKDGWLYTGDLGYVDAAGNVFITGRAKEVIVLSSGKNIYPEEIEAHYLKTPLIKEMCVLGLESKPGEPVSERLHGVIVPNFDELKARRIVNAREALRFEIENLSVRLPSMKRILSYEFWQEDLPRTTTRKIKRFEVERRVRERMAAGEQPGAGEQAARTLTDVDREWLAEAEVQRAIAVVRSAAKTQKAEIHPADNLELDLGLDSMERVELLVALERELGGNVEDEIAAQVYTVREMVEAVRSSMGAPGGRAGAPAWEDVLRQEPTSPEVLAVTRKTPLATRLLYWLTRIANVIAVDRFDLKVDGLEKLPKEGPFIIAPNHQSFLDAPVLVSALPWRVFSNLFYVGTSEIFAGGVWRLLARWFKLVPVDPDANLVPAMQAAAYGLRHGKVLMLYPEGERSIDGTPKKFKKGAAILSLHLRAPIYPVALDGFYEAWPRGKKFQKFTPTRITILDPIQPPPAGANPERQYEELTRQLRSQVLNRWEQMHDELYPEEVVSIW